jgi:probable rRNA maturation factor
MIKINVLVGNKSWKKYIKSPESYLKNKVRNLNTKINSFKKRKLEFSLLLSENKKIKIFNNKFRKKNKVTNVLSFPSFEKKILKKLLLNKKKNIYLGDIIISLEHVLKESKFNNPKEELNKLWIHGFLHLLGERHKSHSDFKTMKRLELKYLRSL